MCLVTISHGYNSWAMTCLFLQQVTGAMKRCEDAWSFSVPARVIVGQGPALCFQQVTGAIGRCECA